MTLSFIIAVPGLRFTVATVSSAATPWTACEQLHAATLSRNHPRYGPLLHAPGAIKAD